MILWRERGCGKAWLVPWGCRISRAYPQNSSVWELEPNWKLLQGLLCKPESLNYALSHNTKIWLALLGAIHQQSRYVLKECLCRSENRKLWNCSKSKYWNCVSQVVMLLWFCQQVMERVKFINALFAKAFPLEPKCRWWTKHWPPVHGLPKWTTPKMDYT